MELLEKIVSLRCQWHIFLLDPDPSTEGQGDVLNEHFKLNIERHAELVSASLSLAEKRSNLKYQPNTNDW